MVVEIHNLMTELYLNQEMEKKLRQKRVTRVKKLLRNLNMKMTIDALELNDHSDE